jgi:hypothetical protein
MINFKMQREISIFDVIAVILSAAALALSLCTTIYSINKDIKDNKENIAITFDSIGYDKYVRYSTAGALRGQGLIGVKYSVYISNNSKQRVSILKCDLSQRVNNSLITYGNLLENVLDSNNKKVLFPLSLDAGDSIRLTLDLNENVTQGVNTLILKKYEVQNQIPFDELRDYLGENGRDIYGNEVKYTKFADDKYLMEIKEPYFPIYILRITSSKNNVFTQTISQNN